MTEDIKNEDIKPTKILEKLHIIQTYLKAPKNKTNSFGHYNYKTCSGILEAIKKIVKEKELKVSIILDDSILLIGDRYYVEARAILKNEDGEEIFSKAYARESDNKKGMDSAQNTGSTSSYARKYALSGLFAIDDTKEIDGMDNSKQQPKIKTQQESKPKKKLTFNEIKIKLENCSKIHELKSVWLKTGEIDELKNSKKDDDKQRYKLLVSTKTKIYTKLLNENPTEKNDSL